MQHLEPRLSMPAVLWVPELVGCHERSTFDETCAAGALLQAGGPHNSTLVLCSRLLQSWWLRRQHVLQPTQHLSAASRCTHKLGSSTVQLSIIQYSDVRCSRLQCYKSSTSVRPSRVVVAGVAEAAGLVVLFLPLMAVLAGGGVWSSACMAVQCTQRSSCLSAALYLPSLPKAR